MLKLFNIDEFSKKLVWLFALNSVIWVYLSYMLAFLGKEQIAENLSEKVIIQIIGVTLIYCLKSLFENLSKHNNWPDKPISNEYEYEYEYEYDVNNEDNIPTI